METFQKKFYNKKQCDCLEANFNLSFQLTFNILAIEKMHKIQTTIP